jgi:hypothetical protein
VCVCVCLCVCGRARAHTHTHTHTRGILSGARRTVQQRTWRCCRNVASAVSLARPCHGRWTSFQNGLEKTVFSLGNAHGSACIKGEVPNCFKGEVPRCLLGYSVREKGCLWVPIKREGWFIGTYPLSLVTSTQSGIRCCSKVINTHFE